MTKSFMVFPTGTTGAGLLLLRITLSAALVACLPLLSTDLAKAAAIIASLAVGSGFAARFAAVAATILVSLAAVRLGGIGGIFIALHGSAALALVLLGPGGFSIDARRFGRRVIDLD